MIEGQLGLTFFQRTRLEASYTKNSIRRSVDIFLNILEYSEIKIYAFFWKILINFYF